MVKPVDGSGGKGIVIGPRASKQELDALRRRVLTDPRGWIAQPVVQLSTVPTLIEDDLRPRHVDLRPFAVNSGEEVWVLPGGLTRVALPEGELVVNSSQGGGSKDTWVLSPSVDQASAADEPGEGPDDIPSPPNAPVEEADEIDDHGPPRAPSPAPPPEEDEPAQPPARPAPAPGTRVPLTISALPVTVMPKREQIPRHQEEQQQQQCSIARSTLSATTC